MSRVDNQRRLFLELVETLRPHWRRDPGQPQRLAEWLARHRAGSRDRRLYRELTYTLWRILPWVEDAAPETLIARVAQHAQPSKATQAFIDAFAPAAAALPRPGSPLLPAWFSDEIEMTGELEQCLLTRAPLWVRQQTGDAEVVRREFPEAEPCPHIDRAWRLPTDTPVTQSACYREGVVEIQDVGSQALLHSLPELPAGRWLDACAGAGGKSLQLAQMLGDRPGTEIVAHDIRPAALRELASRQQRAGVRSISITRKIAGEFDVVMVDAPCSGSGTWRRAPHLKWTTTPSTVQRNAERQHHLLGQFSAHVKPGGWLVYMTCSLCRSENHAVIESFRAQHPEFIPVPLVHPGTRRRDETGQLLMRPTDLDSDGYFIAALRRN